MNKAANENGRGEREPARPEQGLSRSAVRLLKALAGAGAYAMSDSIDEGAVILRAARDGVSVGGGRFPGSAVAELVRHDLAREDAAQSGGRRVRISEAGAAHVRRRAAAGEESFRAQHDDIVDAEVAVGRSKAKVRVDASESPLAWLRRRTDRGGEPFVDAAEFEAGERLRRDLTVAAMLPSVTVNWESPAIDAPRNPRDPAAQSDRVVAARQRVRRAFDAVGSDFAGLLLDLCGFLKGLEAIERERGWPPRSGKVVAKLALGRLADHYGLERSAQGPAGSRGIRSWRAILEGAVAD